jgi:hypothetical protein
MRVNVSAGKIPVNEGFGDNYPMRWDVSMRPPKAHPWQKLHRLMNNMWDLSARGHLCACRVKHRKETPVDNFTCMGSPKPLPVIIMNFGPRDCLTDITDSNKILLLSVKGLLLYTRCCKWPFSILSDHYTSTQSVGLCRAYTWSNDRR